MAKDLWIIDKFDKGLNDHSDSKDIASNEFTVLDDVYIGKKGQARSQGRAAKSRDVTTFIQDSAVIPGEGLHATFNDNSINNVSGDNIQIDLEHTTAAEDGIRAEATFTIEDCVAIINGTTTTGKVRFRLKLVASDGTTTYLMDDDGNSDLLDLSSSGDNQDIGDIFDNQLVNTDNDAEDVLVSKYGNGGTSIFARNTINWNINDNEEQETFENAGDSSNQSIFGVTSTFKALGFFALLIISPNIQVLSHHPYYNYANDYDNDLWEETSGFGGAVGGDYNDYHEYERFSYDYSKLAFAQWIVTRINADGGNWGAELIDSTPLGSQYDWNGPTIKLYSTSGLVAYNDLTIRPEFSVGATLGGSLALVNTPYDMHNNITSLYSNHYVNVADDYGLLRITGDKTTSGAVVGIAEVWKIKLSGENTTGTFYWSITKGDGTEISNSFQITNAPTPEAIIDTLDVQITGACGSFLTTAQEDAGLTLKLTADAGGVTAGFNVQTYIDYQTNVFDFSVGDEQLTFIAENESSSHQVVSSGGTVKKVTLNTHSKNNGIWYSFLNGENAENYKKGINFNWVWGSNTGFKSSPVFYQEGNRLRVVESNFKLPNNNKYIGFIDNTKHFQKLDGTAQWTWTINNVPLGFVCQNNDKFWMFTEGDANYSNNGTVSDYGLLKNAYTDISATQWTDASLATMKLYIYKETSSDGLDWDESVIKVYAAAMYDDGSESMPGHNFLFGASSNTLSMGAQGDADTLKIEVCLRPQNSNGGNCFPDRRVQGVHLYYTDQKEEHDTMWDLGIIDFHNGFRKAAEVLTLDSTEGNESVYEWTSNVLGSPGVELNNGSDREIEYLSAPKQLTYEDYNAFSIQGVTTTSKIRYKTACVAGRRTFIGNLEVTEGNSVKRFNDRMVMSPVNSLDTFPYPTNC